MTAPDSPDVRSPDAPSLDLDAIEKRYHEIVVPSALVSRRDVQMLLAEVRRLQRDSERLNWLARNPPNAEQPMKAMTSISREYIDGRMRETG